MQKLDKIYEAYSEEIKLLLKYISKNEEAQKTENPQKLLSHVNIVSHMNESLLELKDAIVDINIKLNLVVLGKFNSGKSSFINKLMGKNIAVIDDAEMTYSLNYITHGEEYQGRIIYHSGNSDIMKIDELNCKIFAGRYNKQYAESLKYIEYYYPYKELENINLWDTPGVGATNEENKLKTAEIIKEADVVLWVMDGTAIGDTIDKEYINHLINSNIPIICIINKIDLLQEYEDFQKQILDELNIIYPGVFKEIFFCSALEEQNHIPDNQIDKLKEYLTNKIYNKKKELILASSINKGINILQNIYDTLESYSQGFKEKVLRYDNYLTSIKNIISKETDEIKRQVEDYFNNVLFVQEFNQLLEAFNSGSNSNVENLQTLCSKYINDEKLQKYINEIDRIAKNKIMDVWHKTVIKVHDGIYLDDKLFYFSNYHLESENIVISGNTSDRISSILDETLVKGPVGVFLSVIFSGILYLVSNLENMFIGKSETNEEKKAIKKLDKTELDKLKNNIREEYLLKNLHPRIDEANKKIYKVASRNAEIEFLNSAQIDNTKETILVIDKYLPTSERFKQLLNGELAIIDSDELFITNLRNINDFIMLRANPNPGIELLQQILSKATGYLYIVDPYFNDKSLGWIKYINKGLSVKILLFSIDEDIENHKIFIDKLQNIRIERQGSILVRIIKYKYQKGTPIHDRFIFTSSYGLQLGNSLDAIGKKDISVTFIKEHKQFKEQFFGLPPNSRHRKKVLNYFVGGVYGSPKKKKV